MKIDKENAMLLDVQYVREDRANKQPDYLYMIWKEIDSGKKHLEKIPNPPINVYFEKPEYRDHSYFKTEESLDKLDKKVVQYKNVIYAVAQEDGPEAQNFLNQCFQNRNFRDLDRVKLSRYAFGHDYDIRTIYRNMWLDHFDNDKPKHIHKAFGDIEVDIMEANGEPDPTRNPVDLVTVIDQDQKHSYTFILTGVTCPEKDTSSMSSIELDADYQRHQMYAHRLEEQEYWRNHYDELIEEMCQSQTHGISAELPLRTQVFCPQLSCLKPLQISENQQCRNDLSRNGCQCSACHSHLKPKNKERIQHRIDCRSRYVTYHRVSRTAVCSHQMCPAVGKYEKRKSYSRYPDILLGISKHFLRRTEENKHRLQKYFRYSTKQYPSAKKQYCCISYIIKGFFSIASPKCEVKG